MKINLEFNSTEEMFIYCDSVLSGKEEAEIEFSFPEDVLPIGASNWQQAYEHTMANLRRAYERICEFEDLKKSNPVICAEFEKINSTIFAEREQSELQNDLLTNLTFSKRVINALAGEGITTISSLLNRTENDLMKILNLGALSLKDVNETLKANNLKLQGKK